MQEKVKEMKREAKKKAMGGVGGYARGGQSLGKLIFGVYQVKVHYLAKILLSLKITVQFILLF
jgi:hypothetical protein